MKKHAKHIWPWIILFLLGLVGMAQYYVYDSLTSLDQLVQQVLGFSEEEYGLLYSFYSVANVFFLALIFAGILVDRWGTSKSGILFSLLCVLGAILTALGASPHLLQKLLGSSGYTALSHLFIKEWSAELKVMLLGRMIFGVGAESILVVIFKILAHWFWGKQLAFAYAFNTTLFRFGTFLALNLQVPFSKLWSLQGALWVAALFMAFGLICFILSIFSEKIAGKYQKPLPEHHEEEEFRLSDVLSFNASFWLIAIICLTFYSSVLTYDIFGPDILIQKYGFQPVNAGYVASLMMIGTMIFTPIFGWIVDYKGLRASLMIWGSFLAILAFLWLAFLPVWPFLPIIFVGIALSLVPAALWASIPIIIAPKSQGTAFGILGYIQNVGLMLFPWLSGIIADNFTRSVTSKGKHLLQIDYVPLLLLFVGLACISFLLSWILKKVDKVAHFRGHRSIEAIYLHKN